MASNNATLCQAATDTAAVPGFWKLAPERAVTLNPGEAGVLRDAQGQVWVTLDGPHQGPANDWGDMVLNPGEQLRLMPGQHAVVESFGDAVNEPVYFSWEPDASWGGVESSRRALHAHVGVRQPLLDLGAALHQAGWALGRLVQGLAAHALCAVTLRRGTS